MTSKYDKLYQAMRNWLDGRRYYVAMAALEFARSHHTGLRKDNITPEFFHQLSIASHIRTLTDAVRHPEATLAAIFLHDAPEDHKVPISSLRDAFGEEIAQAVHRLTKIRDGVKIPNDIYYRDIAQCPIASVGKGGDRVHNVSSMIGVFTTAKQKGYIEETEEFTIPMLRRARMLFPDQRAVYDNLKYTLRLEIELIQAVHRAGGWG